MNGLMVALIVLDAVCILLYFVGINATREANRKMDDLMLYKKVRSEEIQKEVEEKMNIKANNITVVMKDELGTGKMRIGNEVISVYIGRVEQEYVDGIPKRKFTVIEV